MCFTSEIARETTTIYINIANEKKEFDFQNFLLISKQKNTFISWQQKWSKTTDTFLNSVLPNGHFYITRKYEKTKGDVCRGYKLGALARNVLFKIKLTGIYMLNVWNKNPINSVQASFSFLYTLKTSENLWFSDVFRGYRNGIFASNRLMCCVLCLNHWWPIKTTENNVTLNWNLPAGKIEICRITKKLELLHVFAKLLYFSHSVASICLLSSEFPFRILRAVIFKPHTHLNFWITLHNVNVSCKWMGHNEPELLKWYDGFSYRWAISSSKIPKSIAVEIFKINLTP